MFDLSKITDTIGGLLSGKRQPLGEAGSLIEMLGNAGIDPSQLVGLSHEEILALLQQYGIDPSTIDIGQLSELLQSSGIGSNIAEMAQSWLESRKG